MAEQGEDNEGELRWIQLNTQILQKLITLKKVKEGHQKVTTYSNADCEFEYKCYEWSADA